MGNLLFVIIVLIYISLLFSFCFFYLKKCFEISKLRENLMEIENKYTSLNRTFENTREFRHDFSNILQAIGGYVFTNNFTGFKKYYNSLVTEYKLNR